jgi:hypothetical protein
LLPKISNRSRDAPAGAETDALFTVTLLLMGTEPEVTSTHICVQFAWSWLQVSWLGWSIPHGL